MSVCQREEGIDGWRRYFQNRAIRSGSRSRSTTLNPSATRTTGADRTCESGVLGDSDGGYRL